MLTTSTRHATTISLGTKPQTVSISNADRDHPATSCAEEDRKKRAHQMMIHVIRSIALLLRWSCIAPSYGPFDHGQWGRLAMPATKVILTHQILRHGDLLVQHLHARPDLHVLPHRIVKRLQACLIPEQLGDVQYVAHEVHVAPEREQAAREFERLLAREREHARRGELCGDGARARRGEDPVCERLVVRKQGRLRERVGDRELEEVRVRLECC